MKKEITQQDKFISNVASVEFSIINLVWLTMNEYYLGKSLDEDNCKKEFLDKMPTSTTLIREACLDFYETHLRPKYFQAKREMYNMLNRHSVIENSDFNVNSWLDNLNSFGDYECFIDDYFIEKWRSKFGWAFIPELDKNK